MADPRFAGRDWRGIQLGELASISDVKWVTMDTCVEEATMVMHPSLRAAFCFTAPINAQVAVLTRV